MLLPVDNDRILDTRISNMSLDPYFDAFKQPIDFRKFDLTQHPTAGLSLTDKVGCMHVMTMSPEPPLQRYRLGARGSGVVA